MKKQDRLHREQAHHSKAFEDYYALGEKRSYRRLARQMNVSISAVKLWARSFGWRQRVRERDAQAARQVADQTLHSTVEDHNRYHKIIQMALVRLAKAIAEGKVRMQVADLDRLIRLQTHVKGYQESLPELITAEQIVDFLENTPTTTIRETIRIIDKRSSEKKPHGCP